MRGHGYGALLLERAKRDAANAGFSHVYLCTDHIGYYERYGFTHISAPATIPGESPRASMRRRQGPVKPKEDR